MSGCNCPRALNVYLVDLCLSVFLLLKILQFNFFENAAYRAVISGMWPLSWLGLHIVFYYVGTNCKVLSLGEGQFLSKTLSILY